MVVDQFSDVEADRLFHALADATRRDIVRRVLAAEESVSGLARHYPMSVTAVQKHVAVLEEAGLVARRRQGRELRLSGRPEALQRAQDLVDAFEQVWLGRLARIADVLAADTTQTRTPPRSPRAASRRDTP
jgi:DNA-binding transcriptional ArsR family regulator